MGCCLDWITKARAQFIAQLIISVLVIIIAGLIMLLPLVLDSNINVVSQLTTCGMVLIIFIIGRWFTEAKIEENQEVKDERFHGLMVSAIGSALNSRRVSEARSLLPGDEQPDIEAGTDKTD